MLKNRLIEVLEKIISPIRERRKELEGNKDQIIKDIEKSTVEVQKKAQQRMNEMKKVMKINYFS